MIHVQPSPEPTHFDASVRQPGNLWLAANASPKRPKNLWSPFREDLRIASKMLCGYSAMYEPIGTVDHYLSCKFHRHLAYEWSNYRFCSGWINSSKKELSNQLLDPFEVQDGWFEIILPSLQLIVTSSIPSHEQARAEFTLKRLHLRDDERVIRQRREWYQMYQEGKLPIDGLEKVAPLIAHAVRKQQNSTSAQLP